MATKKKTTTRKATSNKQRPVKKAPTKRATAKKAKGKMSALDAAAKVLGGTGEPMTCKEMIEAMAAKGYWTSPAGRTPSATLYSALLRQMQKHGKDARFRKVDRGRFALNEAK